MEEMDQFATARSLIGIRVWSGSTSPPGVGSPSPTPDSALVYAKSVIGDSVAL